MSTQVPADLYSKQKGQENIALTTRSVVISIKKTDLFKKMMDKRLRISPPEFKLLQFSLHLFLKSHARYPMNFDEITLKFTCDM